MAIQAKLVTAEELERISFGDKHVELVRGAIVEEPPAGYKHGGVGMSLAWRLGAFVERNNLGRVYLAETGFLLSRNPDTVRAPDISFVTTARLAQQQGKAGFFDGAPDLAVEVVSPGDTDTEIQEKVLEYLTAGTRLVWVVRPRFKTVAVYHSPTDVHMLTAEDALDGAEVIPGLAIPLEAVFKD
jgi:Uma2 family endonuclease